VPLAEVAAQARRLVDSGAREIVLTGINIGRYHDGEADLADVVARVAAAGVERLRLSSIEPQHLTERLLAALASTAAVCEHLHVPLQSGSDAVLSRMKRSYTTDEYRACIENARAAIDGLAITTDVIAGFPGETDDDHAQTLAFIETLGFSKLHVFRYSVRPGTPAAQMLQTPAPLRATRAAELRVLGDRMRSGYLDARAGRRTQVLVEAVHADHATGTTRDYLRLRVEGNGFRVGELIGVTLAPGMVAT
jgi:threonylcarbamoyladenosine tRNA methylthiotransferase MtaB